MLYNEASQNRNNLLIHSFIILTMFSPTCFMFSSSVAICYLLCMHIESIPLFNVL